MKKNLVLTGMMGVGKSTIGKLLSEKLKMQFIDVDLEIEKNESMTINDIFKKKGEKYFRNIEKVITLEKIRAQNAVIALGGGSFVDKEIRENILKNSKSFWLDVDLKEIEKRIVNSKKRPLIKNKNFIEKTVAQIYNERKKAYSYANYKINCNKINKDLIRENIIKLFYEI